MNLEEKAREFKAELEAYEAELEQELIRVRKLREEVDRLWFDPTDSNGRVSVAAPAAPRTYGDTLTQPQRGMPIILPDGLTRKQAVEQIVSEFGGRTFQVSEVRKRYLERYPNANTPHLQHAIGRLLRQMYDAGSLERVKEQGRPAEPNVYRKKEKRGEM